MILRPILLFILAGISLIGCFSEEISSENRIDKQIETKYTKLLQIASNQVSDTFYIYIRLPKNYDNSNKRYPVLYLLDGDISFNMAMSTVRYLQFGKDIPELILVAPGYGTMMSDEEYNYRERDYTPTKIARFKGSGGAEEYLKFLEKELIPLIDSTFRTNNERILNGYSLGGLFTIFTLLKKPQLFDSYIAGSPYLINDLKYLIEESESFSNHSHNGKLFISVGEYEEFEVYHKPIKNMTTHLSKIGGLAIEHRIFEGGTHFTCPSEALVYGLKFIYDKK